jgi:hypothetical protein
MLSVCTELPPVKVGRAVGEGHDLWNTSEAVGACMIQAEVLLFSGR